jgi:hypothetical protein
MQIVFDFDGVGDSKIKRSFLCLVDKTVEHFPAISKFIDKIAWVWEILNTNNDKKKIKKIEEFAQKLKKEYTDIEVFILSSRKVQSEMALPLESGELSSKIKKLKQLCEVDRVIYSTDSQREIKTIKQEMQEMLRDGRLKVIKV